MDEVRLYEMYLREAIDEQRFSLLNKNENYKKLKDKFHKILEKYPNLELILEKYRKLILDETECKMLQELAAIYMDILDIEEKEIFLLGGKEMYFYLKDIKKIIFI